MKIKLSQWKIDYAILHNEIALNESGRIGVFVWPDGIAKISTYRRGTCYRGAKLYNPESFVSNDELRYPVAVMMDAGDGTVETIEIDWID